ncbi:MAG: AmmeMemoRadiSam system protein B [Proteobacteria bacterium]|nr:AmmeMemoRadiSam system protein B [Pseudomonadota bacterium]
MKNIFSVVLACSLLIFPSPNSTKAWGKQKFRAGIRQPAVAGRFYPLNPGKLTRAVDRFLEDAVKPQPGRPVAIIAPHAGYIFSGQIAADAFKQASEYEYDVIVLLGANHTTGEFAGVSVYPEGGYRTPLGTVEIDKDLAAKLIAAGEDFTFKEAVHAREHSIEVMVPFVQQLFPKTKILAAVVGTPDLDLCARFGDALAKVLKGKRALIVASSDLSHYPDYEDAVRVDKATLRAIVGLDPTAMQTIIRKQMTGIVPNLSTCACGEAPVLAAIVAAKKLGAACGRIISYANSGDATIGRRHRVVGYGAAAFMKSADCKQWPPAAGSPVSSPGKAKLTNQQKTALLSFARKSIRQVLTTETVPLARGFDDVLALKQGAFVTLKKQGKLRGCIGHMTDDLPLYQAVGLSAVQAAFNDRRFPQVKLEELDTIEIEISALSQPQTVNGINDILVGRDGVILAKDGQQAVFLPSVAVEQGWDRVKMLERLCRKAGLPIDCWRQGARFSTFQAIVFSESNLNHSIPNGSR